MEGNCIKDRGFVSIIITIVPSWAILTALIVSILLSFHRSLRSTKVYDDCTKANAQYVYYLDLRTGDTSAFYARRRTTLAIDMFDDNQASLARIFVPGHVIFGRRDAPTASIDDDKFSDLRATRFWLYRATKLKKVTAIRITHNCTEIDARIMVYALELRTDEPDRLRQFFPVMSYISLYGATSRPNTCFELEPLGSINAIGGHIPDSNILDESLTIVDIFLLINVGLAILFFVVATMVIKKPTIDRVEYRPFIYNGCLAGFVAYISVLILGLTDRFVFKVYNSIYLARGPWAIAYYTFGAFMLVFAVVTWIFAGIKAHRGFCDHDHGRWMMSLGVGVVVSTGLAMTTYLISFIVSVSSNQNSDQYTIPDDLLPDPASKSRQQVMFRHNPDKHGNKMMLAHMIPPQSPSWHHQVALANYNPAAVTAPPGTYYGSPGSNAIGQMYKTNVQDQIGGSYPVRRLDSRRRASQSRNISTGTSTSTSAAAAAASSEQTVGQQQVPPPTADSPSPIKPTAKKVGSNESTGSTYYQQLIKAKGGVKSISQYGELTKQKKLMTNNNKHTK